MAERVFIWGAGSIGMQHAEILGELGASPILIPVRPERCEELKNGGYAVARALDEEVAGAADCCIIATETNRHVDDATSVMKLGLRVLVEKPLGVDLDDIRRLKDEVNDEALRNLRVACPLRWYGAVSLVKEKLTELGRIHAVNICCQSYLPDWRPKRDYRESYSASPEQGGVVRDLVHEIDYCNYLFGLPDAEEIQFVGMKGDSIGVESTSNAVLSWKMGGQALVNIQLDYLTRTPRRSICVFGEHGEINADLISGRVKCELVGRESWVQDMESDRSLGMERMLKSFLRNDAEGCGFQQALEAAKIVDACEDQMRSRE